MKIIKPIFLLLLCTIVLFSCKKNEDDKEEEIIAFIKANNINAVKDPSGLYYEIITPGTGDYKFSGSSNITIAYVGKLLNGTKFDDGGGKDQTFPLGNLITAWQIGVPKIQKGGKIRLICPPSLGYGNRASGPIPPNSPLDFIIELKNVQ